MYLSNDFPGINDSFITVSEIIMDFKFNIESNASHMWMILPKFILCNFLKMEERIYQMHISKLLIMCIIYHSLSFDILYWFENYLSINLKLNNYKIF